MTATSVSLGFFLQADRPRGAQKCKTQEDFKGLLCSKFNTDPDPDWAFCPSSVFILYETVFETETVFFLHARKKTSALEKELDSDYSSTNLK